MKLIFRYTFLFFLVVNSWSTIAQGKFFLKEDSSKKINFELASNLIILPVEINGVTLSFILDTGVSKPILFNLSEHDSLGLKNKRRFFLHGLGADGKLEALKSSYNKIRIGGATKVNQDLYVVYDNSINFTPRLGVLIHGVIGYDVFKDFVVEINYISKYIRLHKPESFRPKRSKKWQTLPINIHKKKSYIDVKATISDKEKPLKLLIDTGSSDALWLFENKIEGLIPNKDLSFVDYLGKGLNGSVYGERSKVKNFAISDFSLKNVNVAFPDSMSIDVTKVYKDRNGSLGGGILKRFNLFFDYANNKLYLKKNSNFNELFTYNNSGIILEHYGTMYVKEVIRVPASDGYGTKNNHNAVQINLSMNSIISLKPIYKIVEIRASSNAYASGIRVGDILVKVNGKPAYDYKLPEINGIFHGKTGKTVRLTIERGGQSLAFKFKLDNAFKKNEPSN